MVDAQFVMVPVLSSTCLGPLEGIRTRDNLHNLDFSWPLSCVNNVVTIDWFGSDKNSTSDFE